MKHQFTLSEFILILFFALILLGGYVVVAIDYLHSPSHLLSFTGIWLIISFFIITLAIDSVIKGVARIKVKIPKKPALLVFGISALLFILAALS